MAGDRGRLFLTALLVYAAFLNPRLANPMAALAGRPGASRTGRLWAALLFAFGTPASLFATAIAPTTVTR